MSQKSNDIYDEDTFIHYENIGINDDEQKELEEKQVDCCVAYLDVLTKYEWLRKLYNSSMRYAFIKRRIENAKKTLNSLLIQ